jgi:hypothetical protein
MTDDWTEYFRSAAASNAKPEQLKEQEMDQWTPEEIAEICADRLKKSPALLRKQAEYVDAQKRLAADIALAAGLIGSGSNIQSANIRLYGSNAAAQGYVTGTGCDEKARGDARYAGLDGAFNIDGVPLGGPAPSFKLGDVLIANGREYRAGPFPDGAQAERTRILTALQSLKPRIRPSHGDWARAWREEAALDMWNKVVALVAQEAPKGE